MSASGCLRPTGVEESDLSWTGTVKWICTVQGLMWLTQRCATPFKNTCCPGIKSVTDQQLPLSCSLSICKLSSSTGQWRSKVVVIQGPNHLLHWTSRGFVRPALWYNISLTNISVSLIPFTSVIFHLANKGPYSHSYGFSSSHVQTWELDHKEELGLSNGGGG